MFFFVGGLIELPEQTSILRTRIRTLLNFEIPLDTCLFSCQNSKTERDEEKKHASLQIMRKVGGRVTVLPHSKREQSIHHSSQDMLVFYFEFKNVVSCYYPVYRTFFWVLHIVPLVLNSVK